METFVILYQISSQKNVAYSVQFGWQHKIFSNRTMAYELGAEFPASQPSTRTFLKVNPLTRDSCARPNESAMFGRTWSHSYINGRAFKINNIWSGFYANIQ